MKEEDFIKLTKKEKLAIPAGNGFNRVEGISRVLFIPAGYKNSGYWVCAFFVCKNGNWFRMMDYDCFRFINTNTYLKGDFEHGGIQFFLNDHGKDNWVADYGGEFKKDQK